MHIEDLTNLGLSENEAKVYLALLTLGATSTGPIIKESGLYRVIVYDTLEKLMTSGLVSCSIRKNRKRFEAEDPTRLIEVIKEKEQLAKEVVRELKKIRKRSPLEYGAYVYEGWQGIKTAQENYFKVMQRGNKERYLMVGASMALHKELDDYFNTFHERRAKLDVSAKLLFNENNRTFGLLKEQYQPVEVRFMPEHIMTPSWVSTYKDLVLTGVADDQMPMAFVVKNSAVAESYRQYFDFMWEQSKR